MNNKAIVSQPLRYALCVGIGTCINHPELNLNYAVKDAEAVAEALKNFGAFTVESLLTTPQQTTKRAIKEALTKVLKKTRPVTKAGESDLIVIYFSCHGGLLDDDHEFYLASSEIEFGKDGKPNRNSVLISTDIIEVLKSAQAQTKNIIFLLDVCHSDGASELWWDIKPKFEMGQNIALVGATLKGLTSEQSRRLQHGIFTHCLLEAFTQEPKERNDAWLNFYEVRKFISQEVERLGATPIQGITTGIDSFPFIHNPDYFPESRQFAWNVKELLKIAGYKPLENVQLPKNAPRGFYIAEESFNPVGRKRTHRIGIIPFYNEKYPLPAKQAQDFARFIKEQIQSEDPPFREGLLVTSFPVGPKIEQIIDGTISNYFDLTTCKDVWQKIMDFTTYLGSLVDDYEKGSPDSNEQIALSKLYIELDASYQDSESSLSFGLEEAVEEWLNNIDPTTTRLTLLADYGIGKSSFCKHLAAKLAKQYLEVKPHEQHIVRIPILIELHRFARNIIDLEDYIVAYLAKRCGIERPNYNTFLTLASAGLLVFILDGFDEITQIPDRRALEANLTSFEKLARIPGNKVLFTTRKSFFTSQKEQDFILKSYRLLHIRSFNELKIYKYLEKSLSIFSKQRTSPETAFYRDLKDPDKVIDMLKNDAGLWDLARRPVFLRIIVDILPSLKQVRERQYNRSVIYEVFMTNELRRQRQKGNLLSLDEETHFGVMEQIAIRFFESRQFEAAPQQIQELSERLLDPTQHNEASLRQILTCSFLERNKEDRYVFSHHSFMNYLVARYLARELIGSKGENLKVLNIPPLSEDILRLLIELDKRERRYSDDVEGFLKKDLLANFLSTRSKDGWLSTNVASILHKLVGGVPPNIKFLNGAHLSGAILGGVNLENAHLSGANLSNAYFENANLGGANLSGANLSGANLSGVILFGADLLKANLNKTILKGAILNNARFYQIGFEEAQLEETNLEDASFWDTNLRRATLNGVKLSGARLAGAKLFNACIKNVDFTNVHFGRVDEGREKKPIFVRRIEPGDEGKGYVECEGLRLENVTGNRWEQQMREKGAIIVKEDKKKKK
jgi:hypothetical protein